MSRKDKQISLIVSEQSLPSAAKANPRPADRYFNKVLTRVNFDIGSKMANFLATGNLVTPTGLDLQQASGFTIVAEKLNWQRYISHFRSIHRGAFFAELKTTTVRKLLPEAWGQSESCIYVTSVNALPQDFFAPSTPPMVLLAVC